MQSLVHLLAGTQCTQCGFPSCEAYANALHTQTAAPNLCRPGGARVAMAVARELGVPYVPPAQPPALPQVAVVNESDCIGCTLCLQKCPTAAIVGATKQLHTVLADMCTGCNLCVPVCPTTCIALQPAPPNHPLTAQSNDGALTAQAAATVWSLVEAARMRQTAGQGRAVAEQQAAAPVELADIPADLVAKIAAARQKSARKYAAKGPLRTPRALKPSKS